MHVLVAASKAWPTGHARQYALPALGACLPAAHAVHAVPTTSWREPGAHAVHATNPE